MAEDRRVVDEHIITIDLEPGVERRIRDDERNATLNETEEAVRDVLAQSVVPNHVPVNRLLNRLSFLRPSRRRLH